MDTDFLEPATRAVLAMTAALLLHHSEDFSRKLQRKFSKSTNLFSKQSNLLPVPEVDQAEQGSDVSICSLSDASSVVTQGPAIVVNAPEEQALPFADNYGAPVYEGTPVRPPLTEPLHGGYAQVPSMVLSQPVVASGLSGGYPRDFETPRRPPLREVYHGSYGPSGTPMVVLGSPKPSYRGRYVYTPPKPELDESYEDESFQLGRRTVPMRTQVLRDAAPLNTSYTAQAPFIRTPVAAVSKTPQRRIFQRQVASESPVILSSTVQRGAIPRSRFFPSEPSPILASPGTPRSMLVRTPQGIRVMTPQEEQSFRLARMPAEQVRARLTRAAQVTPQSPRVSPYVAPVHRESPESIQMARAAQRYHVRSRIARRPPATPISRPDAPQAIPDSAKADSSFRIARPAAGYTRRQQPQSLMDSSLPSFAGFPLSEVRRAQNYSSASTPVSRLGIAFPDLSQLPPTPINVTQPTLLEPKTPSTPQRRVPVPTGSPYVRPRPVFNQSYIAPTPSTLHTPSHIRSPIRPPGWDASTARHLMTSVIEDSSPPQQIKQENLEDEQEIDFAPDMNSTMRNVADASSAQQEQGDDIRDALWTLYSRINRQVAIIQAGDKPTGQERIGIFRRSSADYDAEEGRMRD